MSSPEPALLRREGRVEAVAACNVVVRVARPAGCARCARGEGCGFGLATGPDERHLTLDRPAGLELSPGDRVWVAIEEPGLTRASAAVYGIPLGALVTGAAVAGGLDLGELASIVCSGAAFVLGLAIARAAAAVLSGGDRCRPRLLVSPEGGRFD